MYQDGPTGRSNRPRAGTSTGNESVAATSQALFRWISSRKGTHFRPFLYPVSFVFYAVYRIVYAHPVFIVQLEAGVRAPHSRRLSFFFKYLNPLCFDILNQ